VKRRWGRREKANISRAFILEVGGDDMGEFNEVDIIRGASECRDGS
jgi:hypothetical protein